MSGYCKGAVSEGVSYSKEVGDLIGLSSNDLESDEFREVFAGNQRLEGTTCMQPVMEGINLETGQAS